MPGSSPDIIATSKGGVPFASGNTTIGIRLPTFVLLAIVACVASAAAQVSPSSPNLIEGLRQRAAQGPESLRWSYTNDVVKAQLQAGDRNGARATLDAIRPHFFGARPPENQTQFGEYITQWIAVSGVAAARDIVAAQPHFEQKIYGQRSIAQHQIRTRDSANAIVVFKEMLALGDAADGKNKRHAHSAATHLMPQFLRADLKTGTAMIDLLPEGMFRLTGFRYLAQDSCRLMPPAAREDTLRSLRAQAGKARIDFDPSDRSTVLFDLVVGLALCGDDAGADQAIAADERPAARAAARTRITDALAVSGNAAGAQAQIAKMESTASRAAALLTLARAQVEAGAIDTAREYLRLARAVEIERAPQQPSLVQVVALQIRIGALDDALDSARQLNTISKPQNLLDVANAHAAKGDIDAIKRILPLIAEALRAAEQARQSDKTGKVLAQQAVLYAKTGDAAAAQRIFADAQGLARGFGIRSMAIGLPADRLLNYQARIGDWPGALAAARGTSGTVRDGNLQQLVTVALEEGNLALAMELARDMTDRDGAYAMISRKQAQQGDVTGAKATVALIVDPAARLQAGDNVGRLAPRESLFKPK